MKRIGKLLGFLVLISSAMFPISSASAVVRIITFNTDLFIDTIKLRQDLGDGNDLEADLLNIGGTHYLPPSGRNGFNGSFGKIIYDTFANNYANNFNVGGSTFESTVVPSPGSTNPSYLASASYTEAQSKDKPKNGILTFNLTQDNPNPPAYKFGGTTNYGSCNFQLCTVFHYGYSIGIDTPRNTADPNFLGTFFHVRNRKGTADIFRNYQMASPEIDLNSEAEEDTPKEYLIVYNQQVNPQQPGLAIVNWTEFEINRGQTPTLRFTNSEENFDPMTVSKTRVLRSLTKIPLAQLNATELPPTDANGFVSAPGADGSVDPGEVKTSVDVPAKAVCRVVLCGLVSFDGTSQFVEIPDNDNLNVGTGDLSISAWVKTTSTNEYEIILDKRVESTGPTQGYSLVKYNGSLLLQLADGIGIGKKQFTNYISNISIADGKLHHVAVTVNRNQPDGGHWYLDGVEVVSQRFNPTGKGSLSNAKNLTIGKRSDNPDWPGFFNGEIGSVRIDKRVLSPQEIQEIAGDKPSIPHSVPFNKASGHLS